MFTETPDADEIPLVFDSPHSGTTYPDDFNAVLPLARLRRAEDTYVHELYGTAPVHGAVLMGAHFPRIYIDANRGEEDLDPALLDGAWDRPLNPSRKTELGIGLIWRLSPPGDPIYDRKLTVAEARRRIETFHRPYHATLKAHLDRLYDRFGQVWHINCHSMPARGSAMSEDGPDAERASFVLGDRDGTTCSPDLTGFVRDHLTGRGYDVAVNDPYKGVELVRAYSDPARHRHSLQIEINRKHYMNTDTFERNDGFAALQGEITGLIQALAGFVRARLG
ncbi:MAG: N-formylglutamate amidohydrolase [Hyphomicrobiales bacterium]|nr:N-formylglutamate amidohydrolase [Hyphomicrobiales bacterium]MCP5372409.1 N-formylglutamate amidohydrolase [Hyphomicrobiales bacterium]